jgi:hypothetical protein
MIACIAPERPMVMRLGCAGGMSQSLPLILLHCATISPASAVLVIRYCPALLGRFLPKLKPLSFEGGFFLLF